MKTSIVIIFENTKKKIGFRGTLFIFFKKIKNWVLRVLKMRGTHKPKNKNKKQVPRILKMRVCCASFDNIYSGDFFFCDIFFRVRHFLRFFV